MKIRHEHIREALTAWAMYPGGRKTPAAAIAEAYHAQMITWPHLYGDEHPDAPGRNTQKIFRWIESDSESAEAKIQALFSAIEAVIPKMLLARLRSYDSSTIRDLVSRKQRIDDEFDALFGAILAITDRVNNSGPGGCLLVH